LPTGKYLARISIKIHIDSLQFGAAQFTITFSPGLSVQIIASFTNN